MIAGGNKTEAGKLQINSLVSNLNKYKGVSKGKASDSPASEDKALSL
jgi:hypothetical protein